MGHASRESDTLLALRQLSQHAFLFAAADEHETGRRNLRAYLGKRLQKEAQSLVAIKRSDKTEHRTAVQTQAVCQIVRPFHGLEFGDVHAVGHNFDPLQSYTPLT